jgi:hypothetical protein
MKNCLNCKRLEGVTCQVHGDVPSEFMSQENNCGQFIQIESGESVLNRWLLAEKPGSVEYSYIKALLDAIFMRRFAPELTDAVDWVYARPLSIDRRAILLQVSQYGREIF